MTSAILERMGMAADVQAEPGADEIRILVTSQEDDALLIGRRGDTRSALQLIVNRIVGRRYGERPAVVVDVNDFWARRVQRLARDARELAARVVETGREATSEPLEPQERRVLHRTLADHPSVTTESIGEGSVKRVVVRPSGRGKTYV